jgi:hypothetical protein
MSENREQSHEESDKIKFDTNIFGSNLHTDIELYTKKCDDENNHTSDFDDSNIYCEKKSESKNLPDTYPNCTGSIRNKKTRLNSHTSNSNKGKFTGKLLSSLSCKKIYTNKILGLRFSYNNNIKISENIRKSIFTDFCNYLVYVKLNKFLTDLKFKRKFDMLSYKIVKQNVDIKSMDIFLKKKLYKIYDYEQEGYQNKNLMQELIDELQAIFILSNLNVQIAEALEKGSLKNMKLIQEIIHYFEAEIVIVMLKTEVKDFFNEFKDYVSRESEPKIKMAFDRKKKEEPKDYKKRYLESLNRFLFYYNVTSTQPIYDLYHDS